MKKEIKTILILPDIRSAINVGSIFRTADAAGVNKIYLVGTTPCPNDIFGRIQKDIAKSALGAENFISWEYTKTLLPLILKLKKQGYEIVGLEQAPNSLDYRKYKRAYKIVLILGPEVNGLDKKILAKCDRVIEIPMHGQKESLNVSVAAGIALFRIY